MSTYVYSVEKLPEASEDNPVGVSFSPEETSFLAENLDFKVQKWGFRVVDVHIDHKENFALIKMVLKGPLGFFYRSDYRGAIEYSGEEGLWTVKVVDMSLGPVPFGYVLKDKYHPEWPTSFRDGVIRVADLRLDGKGLRVSVDKFGLELDKILD